MRIWKKKLGCSKVSLGRLFSVKILAENVWEGSLNMAWKYIKDMSVFSVFI